MRVMNFGAKRGCARHLWAPPIFLYAGQISMTNSFGWVAAIVQLFDISESYRVHYWFQTNSWFCAPHQSPGQVDQAVRSYLVVPQK